MSSPARLRSSSSSRCSMATSVPIVQQIGRENNPGAIGLLIVETLIAFSTNFHEFTLLFKTIRED
jgi:hypothetical protein